jgi:hypothetical protein
MFVFSFSQWINEFMNRPDCIDYIYYILTTPSPGISYSHSMLLLPPIRTHDFDPISLPQGDGRLDLPSLEWNQSR